MSARRLRLALVTGDWTLDGPTGLGGGIETYVRVMARGMAAAGHDVHVIGRATGRSFRTSVDGATLHGVQVPETWTAADTDLGEARDALGFAWHAWRQICRLAATDGPFDVVEAPEYKAQGLYLARDPQLPTVVKCHAHLRLCLALNGVPLALDTALLASLEAEALMAARAVHANSRALAARCADDYGLDAARIALVPYGIDTGHFRPTGSDCRQQWRVADARVLLFVGRMEARKGIDTLVPAFAALAARRPDVVLVLAGPDTAGADGRSCLRQMIDAWTAAGVGADRYRVLGPVAHDALPAIYSAADVLVAPSPFEPFGLVYLEAMACGAVPIACAAGGAPEVVGDDAGVLVPPDDVAALEAAMARLLDDGPRRARLRAAGRARVEGAFSLEAVVARTERLYREVAA